MFYAQIIIVFLQLLGLMLCIKRDIEGREAQKPLGFHGVVVTLVVTATLSILYFLCGTYSQLLK